MKRTLSLLLAALLLAFAACSESPDNADETRPADTPPRKTPPPARRTRSPRKRPSPLIPVFPREISAAAPSPS